MSRRPGIINERGTQFGSSLSIPAPSPIASRTCDCVNICSNQFFPVPALSEAPREGLLYGLPTQNHSVPATIDPTIFRANGCTIHGRKARSDNVRKRGIRGALDQASTSATCSCPKRDSTRFRSGAPSRGTPTWKSRTSSHSDCEARGGRWTPFPNRCPWRI